MGLCLHRATGGRFEEAGLCSGSEAVRAGISLWLSIWTYLSIQSADEQEGKATIDPQASSCISWPGWGNVWLLLWFGQCSCLLAFSHVLWNGLVFVSIHQSCRMSLILLFCGLVPVQQERASPGRSCHPSSQMSGLGPVFFKTKLKSNPQRVP